MQPPEVLDVLVNVTGAPINASEAGADIMFLNATASVNEEHDVEVTLEPYTPYLFKELMLHLSVLLPDKDFVSDWSLTGAEPFLSEKLQFRQCASSEFLSERFEVCRKAGNRTGGWASSVVTVAMPAWAPEETHLIFRVVPKKQSDWQASPTRKQALRVMLKGDPPSVGAWAMSPALTGPERCRFLAEVGDLRAAVSSGNQEGIPTGTQEAEYPGEHLRGPREQMYAMSRATCAFIRRNCTEVHSLSFGSGQPLPLTTSVPALLLQHAVQQSRLQLPQDSSLAVVLQFMAKKASPALWSFAQCLAEAGRLPRLANICGTCERDFAWVKDTPGLVCCKFSDDSYGTPLMAEGLFTILRTTPHETDESLVRDTCEVLHRRNASEASVQELRERLLAAAVSTQNLQAINLTLRHCVPDLTPNLCNLLWSLREIPLNLTGLIWDHFPKHTSVLLQAALDSRCAECFSAWDSSLPWLEACTRTPTCLQSRNVSLRYGLADDRRRQDDYEPADIDLVSEIAAKPGITRLIAALQFKFIRTTAAPTQLVKALSQLLEFSRQALASLDIDYLSFGDVRGSGELAASLRELSKLQSLTLEEVQMSSASLAQLLPTEASALPELRALTLSLTEFEYRPALAPFAPFLASRAALRSLELEGFDLPAVEADQFVAALRQLRQLESLKLGGCFMPFTVASQLLANTSSVFPSLQVLGLGLEPSSSHAANSQGIVALSQALAALSPCPLQVLNTGLCGVADEDLLGLLDALEHCRNVTRLEFCRDDCAMSNSSVAALQKRRPQWPKAAVFVPMARSECTRLHAAAADSDGQSSQAMP